MARGPLDGITVLDMSRVLAGPYCTMLLHDLGADIVKIEPPAGGDDARGFGPFIGEKSAYFVSLNRGKKSISLDLKNGDDREIFEALLNKADILVENYRAGTLAKLGYAWEALHQRWPTLIYAAISGFGHTGPYADRAAYDMVVQGMGGIMSITGQPGGEPTRVGSSIGDINAALFAVAGINAALYRRTESGRGEFVDISMLDCQVAILENAIARYEATGQVPKPLGARHPSIAPFEAFRSADGYLIVAAGNDKLFAAFTQAIGRAELSADERFQSNALRCENVTELKDQLESALRENSTEHWLTELGDAGVPCGPINDVRAVLADPQIAARNMVATIHDPHIGDLRVAGNPIKLASYPDTTERPTAPALDADRQAILEFAES